MEKNQWKLEAGHKYERGWANWDRGRNEEEMDKKLDS